MPALTSREITIELRSAPDWSRRARTLRRTYLFPAFLDGIGFVRQVARKAEKFNHHPDIDIRYNKVTLTLTTHDEGGITAKDFTLARKCDQLFSIMNAGK